MDPLHHLLILCCYGGQPFINFHSNIQHQGTHQIDPTDWVATDTAGRIRNGVFYMHYAVVDPVD
uniref:CBM_48 domain-containing protein n=1 Tax=Heterorhabditis bacteriophora TaxID=37862 RepID=A0A1I7X2A0_HETBA